MFIVAWQHCPLLWPGSENTDAVIPILNVSTKCLMSLSAVQEAVNPSYYQIIFVEEHVTDCALVTLIEVYICTSICSS